MAPESVSLILGERRRLEILVENTSGLDCHISSSRYRLMCGDEIEASGECGIEPIDVSTTILGVLVAPQRSDATYKLCVEYDIGDETYVYVCLIRVCGRCSCVQ